MSGEPSLFPHHAQAKHNFSVTKLPQRARIGKAVIVLRFKTLLAIICKKCRRNHTSSVFMREGYGWKKTRRRTGLVKTEGQVLGKQAHLVIEQSRGYLDGVQKNCVSMLHEYLNLSYWA